MRSLLIVALLIVISCKNIHAQHSSSDYYEKNRNKELLKSDLSANEFHKLIQRHNFSYIFTCTDNSIVYGFIGDNFQRIRVKFISVLKSKTVLGTYEIYGKSMVKNNIDEFHGILNISKIRMYKKICLGVDSMYKDSGIKAEGRLIGTYEFSENKKLNNSGVFKGNFQSDFYINKNNNICYDSLSMVSDGYTNNQFVGIWTNYKSKEIKTCNWGDYRIPNCGNLDIGAGEFSPADKYLKYGWQIKRYYFLQSSPQFKQAKQIEEAKWWQ